jgi:hypothetical protein
MVDVFFHQLNPLMDVAKRYFNLLDDAAYLIEAEEAKIMMTVLAAKLDQAERISEQICRLMPSRIDEVQRVCTTIDEAHRLALRAHQAGLLAESAAGNTAGGSSSSSAGSIFGKHSHLSYKVKTGKFDGTARNWDAFIPAFNAAFGNSPTFTSLEKFLLLKSHCTGLALEIRNVSGANKDSYDLVMRAFKTRLGNEKEIIKSLLYKFKDIPKIHKANRVNLQST